jgi:hypothetical protein
MSKNEQKLTLDIGDISLNFTLNRDIFNKYANEMQMNDKVAPSHNFLMRCVDADSKDALKAFVDDTPGSEIELAGALASEYKPDTQIVVKKRSDKPSK